MIFRMFFYGLCSSWERKNNQNTVPCWKNVHSNGIKSTTTSRCFPAEISIGGTGQDVAGTEGESNGISRSNRRTSSTSTACTRPRDPITSSSLIHSSFQSRFHAHIFVPLKNNKHNQQQQQRHQNEETSHREFWSSKLSFIYWTEAQTCEVFHLEMLKLRGQFRSRFSLLIPRRKHTPVRLLT